MSHYFGGLDFRLQFNEVLGTKLDGIRLATVCSLIIVKEFGSKLYLSLYPTIARGRSQVCNDLAEGLNLI